MRAISYSGGFGFFKLSQRSVEGFAWQVLQYPGLLSLRFSFRTTVATAEFGAAIKMKPVLCPILPERLSPCNN